MPPVETKRSDGRPMGPCPDTTPEPMADGPSDPGSALDPVPERGGYSRVSFLADSAESPGMSNRRFPMILSILWLGLWSGLFTTWGGELRVPAFTAYTLSLIHI
jgi:hypothetical protein